jgi:membrane-associated protein
VNFDLAEIIKTIGYLGVFSIVFAESGLLFGFFLPGDSLLFTAGFLASQGFFNIAILMILCVVGAIAGDSVGYFFGKRVGKKLFDREDSRFFKKKHLMKAHEFYELHGGKTIILARFIPVVRTFAPIVAGTAEMTYRSFLIYNVVGGVLWAVGLTAMGFALGHVIPEPDKYLLPIIILIVLISVAPAGIHALKDPETRASILKMIKR